MGRYELKLKQKQIQNVDNKIRTRAGITKTTPYHFYDLRSRRRNYRTETTTSLSSFRSSNSFLPESCRSSNLTAVNSTELPHSNNNYVTSTTITSEITADNNLEVESGGETSSKLTDCHKLSSEIETNKIESEEMDGVDLSTMKSTVQIKPIKMMMMPSQFEIDDFFTSAENELHKRFSDKYNFDVVKDVPLEGRYEWVQIKP